MCGSHVFYGVVEILFRYLSYPLEEFVEGIVTTMRTVPSQKEVHVFTGILEFRSEVDGHGEGRVAVACPMTDIPMGCHRCIVVADKTHGIQQSYVLANSLGDDAIILLSRIVGEVDTIARPVTKLLVLATRVVDAFYQTVEGRNTLQWLSRNHIVEILLHVEAGDVFANSTVTTSATHGFPLSWLTSLHLLTIASLSHLRAHSSVGFANVRSYPAISE